MGGSEGGGDGRGGGGEGEGDWVLRFARVRSFGWVESRWGGVMSAGSFFSFCFFFGPSFSSFPSCFITS